MKTSGCTIAAVIAAAAVLHVLYICCCVDVVVFGERVQTKNDRWKKESRLLSMRLSVSLYETCSFPTIPWENNHYGHFGNPALEAFSCNISSAADFDSSPSCELIDVVTENVKGVV